MIKQSVAKIFLINGSFKFQYIAANGLQLGEVCEPSGLRRIGEDKYFA